MDNDTPVAIKRISQPWGIHGGTLKSTRLYLSSLGRAVCLSRIHAVIDVH